MIRDKRKVSPAGADKPTEATESNGSEATASEPADRAEAASATAAEAVGDSDRAAPPSGGGKASGDQAPGGAQPGGPAAADKAKPAGAGATKPATQEATEPADEAQADAQPTVEAAELGQLRSALDERTADLQRITAEYANYRKRVERDRAMAGELAVGMVLSEILTVLDDIDRARDHDDLNGPFAAVADKLTTVTSKFGLTAFGSKGDAFDPNRHEAVAHQTSPDVTEPTCIEIMRRGYLLGERMLRPALVAVADPESE